MQDAAHQQADRLVPVQVVPHGRVGQDGRGVAQVAVATKVTSSSASSARAWAQHDRVVVDVDHAGGGLDPLGDLVHVLRGRQARADVQQLPHAGLADQVADHAAEDVTLGPHAHLDGGQRRDHLVADGPVGGEVVLAAQQVVVDAGDVRFGGVERGIRHQPMLAEVRAAPRWACVTRADGGMMTRWTRMRS